MELEELIVEIVIGLFLLFTSYQIGIKENITLLHGYHYTQLDPKDKKVFTKKIGIGTLLVSIGILVMPIINLISHSELGYYIGLILIFAGVFYIIFPSLTVGRQKSGYKPSKYGRCSRFLSCIDMCYISVLFTTFVFLIIVRIEVFVIIS